VIISYSREKFHMPLATMVVFAVGWALPLPTMAAEARLSSGMTYYVDSETGADTNNGSTRDNAFRTLAKATAALDRAGGDTLIIRGSFRETLNLAWVNYSRGEVANPESWTTVRRTAMASTAVVSTWPRSCQARM
jgi:hypothetical protein